MLPEPAFLELVPFDPFCPIFYLFWRGIAGAILFVLCSEVIRLEMAYLEHLRVGARIRVRIIGLDHAFDVFRNHGYANECSEPELV